MATVLLVLVSFLVMEPVAYLAHRFVMHGFGDRWHCGHHRTRHSTFEANDLYPVVMAALTIVAFALGGFASGYSVLTPVASGVALYGLAYLYVHDIAIHRRVRWAPVPDVAALRRLREAHRIHHLWGGEPYGFLCPVVPRLLWERASTVERDPLVVLRGPSGPPGRPSATSGPAPVA